MNNFVLKNLILKITRFKDLLFNIDNVLRLKTILLADKIYTLTQDNKTLYREFIYAILAKNLSSKQRLIIIIGNLTFINKIIPITFINKLQKKELWLWISDESTNTSKIRLDFASHGMEGFFRLYYLYNEETIFTIGFTIAPGDIFGVLNKDVIFISNMQLIKNRKHQYQCAINNNSKTTPQRNLFYSLFGIAEKFKINHIVCVDAESQISNDKGLLSFQATYNDFMSTFNGVHYNNYFHLPLPYIEKDSNIVSSTHRRRNKIKRIFNNKIKNSACLSINKFF